MSVPNPTTLGLSPSFGFGDRIGLATAGHVEAVRRSARKVAPIYAQQSIREMARTGRTPEGVMTDTMEALKASDWNEPHGADADHLKTPEDANLTASAGFTFFTLDPSEDVDQEADDYDEAALREKFARISEEVDWLATYRGKSVALSTGSTISFDERIVLKAAVKYGRAIRSAISLGQHIHEIQTAAGREYELELSIDETQQATTLAEHYIIADQFFSSGMQLISLAPRFIGELEKGVDYIGNVDALHASLRDHAAIAELLGPYKLSLHSGSDKLSMYSALSSATNGRFHVKTAGTSYLEALRVVAVCLPDLFREICMFARTRYENDRATYHVHANLTEVPEPEDLDDSQLVASYLENWESVPSGKGFSQSGRQILHCTFGSVINDERLGTDLRQCLMEHHEVYAEILAEHFGRHLSALQAG